MRLMAPSNIGSFQPGSRAVIRTKTTYDGNGRVVALTDDRGGQTTYGYDLLDRQISMTFADGSTRTSQYNLAGDLTGYTDENGSTFVNTYDPLGRRTYVTITPATGVIGTTAQSFQYDDLSRLTQATDVSGSNTAQVAFYYDSLNRLVEEDQTYGPTGSGDVRYVTHDKFASNVATDLMYPNTRQVGYGYDALYRRNGIAEAGGTPIVSWDFFGYRTARATLNNGNLVCSYMNNAGTRSAAQEGQATPPWGDNTTDRLGYDGSGRLIAKRYLPTGSTTCLVGFTTEYDPAGNKLFDRALHAESRSGLYPGYDSINRLLEYQRGVLASGGGSITTAITLPGTDSDRTYELDHLGNWKNTTYTPEGGSPTPEVRRHNLVNQTTKYGSTPVLYDHGNNAASANPLIAAQGNGNIADDG
jgi:YD repeat-containing protein